jgi:hypothetical protein
MIKLPNNLQWVSGVVARGQGVASGRNPVEGGIYGTIRAQKEFFRRAGIDIDRLYDGTINVDITPWQFEPIKATLLLRSVPWHPTWMPETFSLFACKIYVTTQSSASPPDSSPRAPKLEQDAFIYYPHPETKPGAFPGKHIAEVWSPFIDGVEYGNHAELGIFTDLLRIIPKETKSA